MSKIQIKQLSIKKLITSTIIFSGIFLVIFNINFSFLQTNNIIYINKVFANSTPNPSSAPPSLGGGATDKSAGEKMRDPDVSVARGSKGIDNLHELMAYGVLKMIAKFISGMIGIIKFSLSEGFVNTLFESPAIYTGWKMVRDTLNIMFIFFLLFSAFSTIFQVSKYHIKSTWVMIVVMALLVNFSWPVTRVIIDFSNVTMDHILGSTGTTTDSVASSGLMGQLANNSKFFEMMIGETYFVDDISGKITFEDEKGAFTAMLMGIVVGAIFLFTVGAIALLLLIRVILMAVLLVFASAGFVFAAFPSTRSISSKWWKALLDQAVLGPIVLFSLLLAVGVMGDVSTSTAAANKMIEGQLKNLPQYSVAIILIWTGILAAKSISGQTANLALSGARKVRGAAWKSSKFGAGVGDKIIAGGVNRMNRSDNKTMKGIGRGLSTIRSMPDRAKNIYKSKQKASEDALAEAKAHGLNDDKWGGDKNALKNVKHRKINELMKEYEIESTSVLANKAKTAKGSELTAIIKTLGKRDDVSEKEMKKLAGVMDKLDSTMQKAVIKKAQETGNAHTVLDAVTKLEEQKIAEDSGVDIGNLSSTQKNDARKSASVSIYNGMDGKTFAKQKETIKQISSGNMDFQYVGYELNNKLDRVGFARDMQHVDSKTYANLESINNTNL